MGDCVELSRKTIAATESSVVAKIVEIRAAASQTGLQHLAALHSWHRG